METIDKAYANHSKERLIEALKIRGIPSNGTHKALRDRLVKLTVLDWLESKGANPIKPA